MRVKGCGYQKEGRLEEFFPCDVCLVWGDCQEQSPPDPYLTTAVAELSDEQAKEVQDGETVTVDEGRWEEC